MKILSDYEKYLKQWSEESSKHFYLYKQKNDMNFPKKKKLEKEQQS